jgi:tryptophanyl-tRNA synthetase
MSKKGRVFSGARPTGRQHLGNYLGAIRIMLRCRMIMNVSIRLLMFMH